MYCIVLFANHWLLWQLHMNAESVGFDIARLLLLVNLAPLSWSTRHGLFVESCARLLVTALPIPDSGHRPTICLPRLVSDTHSYRSLSHVDMDVPFLCVRSSFQYWTFIFCYWLGHFELDGTPCVRGFSPTWVKRFSEGEIRCSCSTVCVFLACFRITMCV